MSTNLKKNEVTKYKKILLEEKERILNNARNSIKNEEIATSIDDLSDETDLAASEVNQNLIFKMRDRERVMLSKIDQALQKMEEGTFGQCESCEEPIEPKRLEARPVSDMCVACKEADERRAKVYA